MIYTGVTNNLKTRLYFHQFGSGNHFTSKYRCFYLIFWERHQYVDQAIRRETQIKAWGRSQKENLIKDFNPHWEFLNDKIG